MKKMLKRTNGITLIALVITIIVLLILAGVSIAMLTGENGILTKVTDAKTQTQIGEERENINLSMQALLIDKINNPNDYPNGIINNNQLKEEMDKSMPKPKEITMNELTKELSVKFDETRENREYIVEQTGKIGEAVNRDGIKVGDYVDYKYDVAENYIIPEYVEWCTSAYSNNDKEAPQDTDVKWKILKIYDDGRVDLISDTTVSSVLGVEHKRMGNAYNNAVFLMNDICKHHYSNKEMNIIARSINLEDIESQMIKEKVEEYKKSYNNGTASYGDIKTFTGSDSYYPNIYAEENGSGIGISDTGKTEEELKDLIKKDGIGRSDSWYTELTKEESIRGNNLTVMQTYYELNDIKQDDFINKDVYDIIFNGGYWIASRYVNCVSSSYAELGTYMANNNSIHQSIMDLFNTYQGGYTGNIFTDGLRPIVTLNKDIIITPCTGKNTIDNMHKISK